jgi:RNA-binding protein NOB1
MTAHREPRCRKLVLDSGPLLSLSPLRGLAETYLTVPQVLAELKDSRAREHFERLGLLSGVEVKVQSPDAASLAHGKRSSSCIMNGRTEGQYVVIQWAKKTGDYSVLSHPDLCVLALTYLLSEEDKKLKEKEAALMVRTNDNTFIVI